MRVIDDQLSFYEYVSKLSLRWRHNELDGVSDHQSHDCLLNRLFGRRSKKTSKLRVTGLCAGNSPGTGEFPAQKASNAENVSIWWRHHGIRDPRQINVLRSFVKYPSFECKIIIYTFFSIPTLIVVIHCGPFVDTWIAPTSHDSEVLIHPKMLSIMTIVKSLIKDTPNSKTSVYVSFCSCICPIHWRRVLSREWICRWSSAHKRCPNYIWVISKFIAY